MARATVVSRPSGASGEPVNTVAEGVAALPASFRVDPFAPRPQLLVEPVDSDPRKEAQRWIERGRAAFVAEEYGRAVQLFATAADKDRTLPFPRYWQAQAEIAAGRYANAFAALRLGLQHHPQVAQHFDPKELYGSYPQRHAEHLVALRRAVTNQPQEPILAYLLAWQLWLSGEKTEARRWWERSQSLGGPADWLTLFP
jgi:thioredoxin-like negative regulator of GroEL